MFKLFLVDSKLYSLFPIEIMNKTIFSENDIVTVIDTVTQNVLI